MSRSQKGKEEWADAADSDAQLLILEAKRNAIYELLQQVYDLTPEVQSDIHARESFLNQSANIENLRSEFIQLLDTYNTRLLEINPLSKPNYKSLVSFEQLYGCVKRLRTQYIVTPKIKGDTVPHKSEPKLPPIELQAFSGDIRSWPLFYASFKSTIHDNPSLTDAEKMYYLLGKISGKAQATCSGITPCADNYHLLFQTLVDKYEDKRTLASTHLNQMFDFKPLTYASADNFELFIDKFINAVRALRNINLDNLSDFILLHIALKKIDCSTIRAFEMANPEPSKIPTFEQLVEFIKKQCKILQRTPPSANNNNNNIHCSNVRKVIDRPRASTKVLTSSPPNYQTYLSTVDSNKLNKCLCTNITHLHMYKCPAFNKMLPEERFKAVKENNSCVNCLSIKHRVSLCNSNMNCRICKLKHHTLLHFNRKSNQDRQAYESAGGTAAAAPAPPRPHAGAPTSAREAPTRQNDIALCATSTAASQPQCYLSRPDNKHCTTTVLLATARVATYDTVGKRHLVRVLLDSASMSNFITKECCDRLGIRSKEIEGTIVKGFGGTERIIKGSANFEFSSRFNSNVKYNISSLITDKITDVLPTAMIDKTALPHLEKLPLADDTFAIPASIDVLIGASLFPHLILPDVVSSKTSAPPAINTVLGYVIMGSVPTVGNYTVSAATTCCMVQETTANIIKKFWELEELSVPQIQCQNDIECEEFYRTTTERDIVSGRYTVGLPFIEDVFSLGNSYDIARKRFLYLERKLEASPKLRVAYDEVIREYIEKQYLSLAPPDDPHITSLPMYVIPHHGVVREDKTSTRLRIVLDASSRTSSGRSLNDCLHSGPNLQGNLFNIILNFRLYPVALTADCRQQFLQIGMRVADRRFQRILYRFDPQKPLELYEFNRVCFGLKSSPYHALRTVKQLILDDGCKYPLAKEIASTSLYMDDIAFSVMTDEDGIAVSRELIDMFKGAQWDLVKWNSNSQFVLDSIPTSHKFHKEVEFDKSMSHKILGLHWSTDSDNFYFKLTPPALEPCTKRTILSTIARLWDLMGFVAPTVLFAKLLIKQLWQLGMDWDDVPPPSIVKIWKQFCIELPILNSFKIPRHLGVTDGCILTLVGFSDASELGYGGVVYLHVSSANTNTVRLVCAKSKVAPSTPLTVARLELCGVVLLSKLLRAVFDSYVSHFSINVYAFTDSKVALYWIQSSPHRWQTFVANRVVQVTDNFPADRFFHVAGSQNPADCLSRGVTPKKLVSHPLWLHGPPWLSLDPSQWPVNYVQDQLLGEVPEQKILTHSVTVPEQQPVIYELAQRMSSWSKLLRVIVFVYRYAKLLPRRHSIAITAHDLEFVENKLLQVIQHKYFLEEINKLKNNKPASPAFNKLTAFFDNGLVRVGGRLTNSELGYAHKHPVILPRQDHIIDILIDYYHKKYMHAGPELLMSLLRQRFWILSARRIVRRRIHQCNVCFRMKPRSTYPLMANLPDSRVRQVAKAFTYTACDYAGPIAYVPIRRRGVHSLKAYICLFTCLTTRAVHIEIATDLSTGSFLAALKRFLARRGPVQHMYSDRGTNFQGAKSYLRDLYNFLNKEYRPRFEEELSENRIEWTMICPNSPHFGGSWESMIKVIKTHLFKVIGHQLLSYEELNTVLVQIECLLNSRPLTVLSPDPAEPLSLTPSHFLHTAPLCSLPAPEVTSGNLSLLQRQTLLDKLVQSFWERWRLEYLHSLQIREKWNTPSVPIKSGTVVVIITDNAPPLAWPLAIVERVHPSKDGIIRVATVKTVKGTYLRPVVRLCPLPTQ